MKGKCPKETVSRMQSAHGHQKCGCGGETRSKERSHRSRSPVVSRLSVVSARRLNCSDRWSSPNFTARKERQASLQFTSPGGLKCSFTCQDDNKEPHKDANKCKSIPAEAFLRGFGGSRGATARGATRRGLHFSLADIPQMKLKLKKLKKTKQNLCV